VNIVLLSVEREEGDLGNVVLTFTILAKTISNIGWFIMWVQQIEVNLNKEKFNNIFLITRFFSLKSYRLIKEVLRREIQGLNV
jgi:hypothetical protein